MKYESGSAFRRALEDRLRSINLKTGVPLVRLRKMVAFDRFLARLATLQPESWLLKGGFALQLRLGDKARTTKDIDLLVFAEIGQEIHFIRASSQVDLNDWFLFEVEPPTEASADEFGGLRFQIHALLDGRPFETFHIDIGIGDPVIGKPDALASPGLLKFADIEPIVIQCYPLAQQIAEKLHAYTGSYTSGVSSRVKDMIDILLIAGLGTIEEKDLAEAIEATFKKRNTRPIPKAITPPPINWEQPFKKMAKEVGLGQESLDEGFGALQNFLNPILMEGKVRKWDPMEWKWD